ncbi:uncharacterized protein TNCV_1471951 [Trichonephila clavipes]|nr:uncharacterized protein TNCV_1471951 [Trichonephila clavipes]
MQILVCHGHGDSSDQGHDDSNSRGHEFVAGVVDLRIRNMELLKSLGQEGSVLVTYPWYNTTRLFASQSDEVKNINNLVALHFKYDQARRRFVKWAQNEIAVAPDFHKRILFSDEAHFWLNGYVEKQNCRIWKEANPQVYVEIPLHSEKLTVWCALWAGGIIGSYFFKNDEGHNVTVNGDRYRAMIINFFIPALNNHDVQNLWFNKTAQHVTQLVP